MLERAVGRAVDAAATTPTATTVDAAVGMVRLARELALDVSLDVAQERIYDALGRGRLDLGARELLAPLARRLGVAPRTMDLPA
jgi:hypothetical protein